jgi:amylosucrase
MPDLDRARTGASHERGRATLARLRPALAERAGKRLKRRDADALVARVERRFPDVYGPLEALYGADHDLDALLGSLLRLVTDAARARSKDLRLLDHRREIDPGWHLDERQIGYVCYTERFAGSLEKVADRLDYLEELGVTYLHLMPLLRPRPAPNDGGYAVADFRTVDPRLGEMDDLERLAEALRARGVSLCIDLVVNHTAQEHEWARRARDGKQEYRDYYLLFPDRTLPDAYERTLLEVFPDTAPGSFTWNNDLDAWVWTTFYEFQWDLNYANPRVFAEMLDVMLFLANRGVEILRLDAVPFLWKRLGTTCQNQPEAHLLLQAFRGLVAMAAPAMVFKAEAIVPPNELVKYLGTDGRYRPECELAYHNQLNVMLWSSLAARDVQLMTTALGRMAQPPPTASWATYVRNHDDIGWAVSEEDAGILGLSGTAHRRFLNDFYSGRFPGSFARGAIFQENLITGDARISGTTASLCGIEQALQLGDEVLLDHAIRRFLLLYGVTFAYGGVPLIYMGDEVALPNDLSYLDDPETARDNRWLHRPFLDEEALDRRTVPGTVEHRIFNGLARFAAVRRRTGTLRAGGQIWPVATDNPRVFAFLREHPRAGRFLGLANVGDDEQSVDAAVLDGISAPRDALSPHGRFSLHGGRVWLPRLSQLWLTED